jgi:hypothetical protein
VVHQGWEVKIVTEHRVVKMKRLATALFRVGVSLLFGATFYIGWLAIFLAAFKDSGTSVKVVLWVIAPIVTAAGFAVGLMAGRRLCGIRREAFFRTFAWPLVGCVLGAVLVVWFGPMLIVFGMFLFGTGTVALREAVEFRRITRDGGGH